MTVQQIQHLLNYLGYDTGGVEGIYGPKTKQAVLDFQTEYGGITVDGQAGSETEKALKDSVAYDKFRPPDVPESGTAQTGTFWDDIRYFTPEEFACKCGRYHAPYCDGYPAQIREEVVRLCEGARIHFGLPAEVISGLRCQRHNADSGGVSNSQHMYGEACDLYIAGVSGSTLCNWFLKQPGVRYAYVIPGTNNVHFDIPKGNR